MWIQARTSPVCDIKGFQGKEYSATMLTFATSGIGQSRVYLSTRARWDPLLQLSWDT